MNEQNPPSSEKPLFLAPNARPGNGHGYVNAPEVGMSLEPECMGPAILDGYAESARFYDSLRHRQHVEAAQCSRKLLSAENRLRDAQRRAKQQHVTGLKLEFNALEAMLERARRSGQPDPPSAVRKLEKIEGRLDGLDKAA